MRTRPSLSISPASIKSRTCSSVGRLASSRIMLTSAWAISAFVMIVLPVCVLGWHWPSLSQRLPRQPHHHFAELADRNIKLAVFQQDVIRNANLFEPLHGHLGNTIVPADQTVNQSLE